MGNTKDQKPKNPPPTDDEKESPDTQQPTRRSQTPVDDSIKTETDGKDSSEAAAPNQTATTTTTTTDSKPEDASDENKDGSKREDSDSDDDDLVPIVSIPQQINEIDSAAEQIKELSRAVPGKSQSVDSAIDKVKKLTREIPERSNTSAPLEEDHTSSKAIPERSHSSDPKNEDDTVSLDGAPSVKADPKNDKDTDADAQDSKNTDSPKNQTGGSSDKDTPPDTITDGTSKNGDHKHHHKHKRKHKKKKQEEESDTTRTTTSDGSGDLSSGSKREKKDKKRLTKHYVSGGGKHYTTSGRKKLTSSAGEEYLERVIHPGTSSQDRIVGQLKNEKILPPLQKLREDINNYQYNTNSELLEYVMVDLYKTGKDKGLYGNVEQDNDSAPAKTDDDGSDTKKANDIHTHVPKSLFDPKTTTTTTTTTTDDDELLPSTEAATAAADCLKKFTPAETKDFLSNCPQEFVPGYLENIPVTSAVPYLKTLPKSIVEAYLKELPEDIAADYLKALQAYKDSDDPSDPTANDDAIAAALAAQDDKIDPKTADDAAIATALAAQDDNTDPQTVNDAAIAAALSDTSSAPEDKKLSDEYIDFDDETNNPMAFSQYHSDDRYSTPTVDKINKYAGYANDVLALTGIGSTVMNLREVYPGKDDNGKQKSLDDIKTEQADARRAFSGLAMLSSGIGFASNIMSLYSDTKKMDHSKNKRKRRLAENNNLKNSLGLMTNLFKFINSGIGLFGDPKDTDQQAGSTLMSVLTDIAAPATAYMALKAGIEDRNDRKQIIKNISKLSLSNGNDWAGNEEKQSKTNLRSIKDKKSDAYKEAKMKHNALKSKKYALQEAAQLHDIKKGSAPKGIIGSVVSSFTSAVDLVGYIPGAKSSKAYSFFKAINPVVSTIGGYASKYGEKAMDLATDSKVEAKKIRIIQDYITRKSSKIQEQADNAFKSHPNAAAFSNLSHDEKERIVVARMGVDVPIIPRGLEEDKKMEAYNIRNKKQAKAIMNSGKKEREQMLKALMLENDATLEDIESALKGD